MGHKYFGEMLKGKRAIITGASKGLGLLMARRFLECGAKVAVLCAPFEEISPVIEELRAIDSHFEVLGYKPNLTDETELSVMMADIVVKWGGVDILVNNAGIYPTREFEEYPKKMFEDVFELNVTAPFVVTKQVLKVMKENENGGVVLNTSSMAGTAGAMRNIGYTASKHAVEGITKGLARELGQYGIRVNGVAPAGIIRTDVNGSPIVAPINSVEGYNSEDAEKWQNAYQIANKFAPMG
ncbi:MAG: SDR family oxidoreductase, partial [Peptococcaceae bacterium]|nr:SDR family oxidoreductase [Peptococcaceae bacterium]